MVSATVAATASPWVPVFAAAVGAGAALVVGVLTQLWTGHRENVRWSREREDRQKQWEREDQARQEQRRREDQARQEEWRRERDDRQEQWQREDRLRWLQGKQAAYAGLIAGLDEWDHELGSARAARTVDAEFPDVQKLWPQELDTAELKHRGKTARDALALVQFMAPKAVGGLARRTVQDREEFQVVHLATQPTDAADLNARWDRLRKRRRELLTAMREDLGLETTPEGAER